MAKIQEINWNNFKAKFNGKEQSSFERLCYLLFYKEFGQKIGISKYKNQAGIETNPVEIDGKKVGWQAKFYDTRLSEHKNDFLKTIKTTKAKYPEVDKIIFYTNQDFSQGAVNNDPKFKVDIENLAKIEGLEVEWRTASFFESPFVCEENSNIAQHFFSLEKSTIDLILELLQHTELVLMPIESKIKFNGCEIKIDRTQDIVNLQNTFKGNSMVIVSGEAGVGKTALIKDFYEQIKDKALLFMFKAIEFDVSNINKLFANYGNFTLSGFIEELQDFKEKFIVIDSAEKLSDIKYQDVFQEFLSALLENDWKIIFTTRYSYLDDLKFQFVGVYHTNFNVININKLTIKEITQLSERYKFNLPGSGKLVELLQTPFYLNEYLQIYENAANVVDYSEFKNAIWQKKISKTVIRRGNIHVRRESCFLEIARKIANEGGFFVRVPDCDNEALQQLEADDIIKYDSNVGGYFITQDIYEELALERIIESAFRGTQNYRDFYKGIGSSLPIRRAFREWISEKLFISANGVKSLIELTIIDESIEKYWKDEVLISVLLSDYSAIFFKVFENKFLKDEKLLMRIIFLLRVACKDIDEDFLNSLGIEKEDAIKLKTLFTRPKGKGWNCVIDFIHKHKSDLGLHNINTILLLLSDWNNKNTQGEITKKASQIALYYYNAVESRDYGYFNADKKQLIRVILQGASEITDELKAIFDEVITQKQINYRDKYYELIETILTSIADSYEVTKSLPNYILKLADLFWFKHLKQNDVYDYSMGVEKYFGLSEYVSSVYFPASAFQTPIYNLLRFAPKETIDFILSFTNKCIGCYANSGIKDEIEEVEVFIDEAKPIKQYISDRLWNMYRGTQVSTDLLESIHMALEKWLLENAKSTDKETLENWCLYIIKGSKSASLTAVIESIVLAYPSKLFRIASILFKTKEFFLYDTRRLVLDQTAKSTYSIGYGLDYRNKLFQDERIKTCDEIHRKDSLEILALKYQLLILNDETEDEVKKRQEVLWKIFDKYYQEFSDKSLETDFDKTWKLYLARMDTRKMKHEIEEKDGQLLIKLIPDINAPLREFSKNARKEYLDETKHMNLKLWSDFRFRRETNNYLQYLQYENNPESVIAETRELIKELKNRDEGLLSYSSVPAYACSVLIRDFFDKLNQEEKELCKNVIVSYASIPLKGEHYYYQIGDGVEPSIVVLPYLLKYFPKDKTSIKSLLLLLLLSSLPKISAFVVNSISQDLWEINYNDADAIFLGYLFLKPLYSSLRNEIKSERYQENIYECSEAESLELFSDKYKSEIEKVISNKISYDELNDLEKIDLETLLTAFELLPLKTENEDHKKFLNIFFNLFSKVLFSNKDFNYSFKERFMKKFVCFILNSTKDEIGIYLKPFVGNFDVSRDTAMFLQYFIFAEDNLGKYEEFWTVWNYFYDKISEICKKQGSSLYTKEILHNYLLAIPYWREDVKEWHTLKERERIFFKKVSEEMGYHPSTIYSISKVLNDIGSNFIDDGIIWISDILQKNDKLASQELDSNTVYYMENAVRRYILINDRKIKMNLRIKNQVIIILNFLVEIGSTTGYFLREYIL